MNKLEKWLDYHDACSDAVDWVDVMGPLTFAEAWDKCPHKEWKLWAVDELCVRPYCDCPDFACTGLCQYVETGEDPELLRDAAIAAFDAWVVPQRKFYNRSIIVALEVRVTLLNTDTTTPDDVAKAVLDTLTTYNHRALPNAVFAVHVGDDDA